ncbi:MAG: serine/threonine protein kinase [Byssovorax cruenta]
MQWLDTTIGKVRIEKQLARGGMAEVYLGTHLTLDRPVAVKVLHSYIESDDDMKTRFQREAKVVAALRHPNIVQIFDFDTIDGHPYIVMEYIRGPSLALYLKNLHERNERMQPPHVARLIGKLASALDYAHQQGVIHRDIKPGNILLLARAGVSRSMFTDQIEPIITDFGLVRIMHATTQTASGLVSGTPAYISPEQAQGLRVDHRTDIYSLGVILYEILAGRVPFDADSTWSVIYKHIHEAPPPITDVPPAVQAVVDRAMAKNPDERYQSCRDLALGYLHAIGFLSEASTLPFVAPAAPASNAPTAPSPASVSEPEVPNPPPARRRISKLPIFAAGFLVLLLSIFGFSRLFTARYGNELPTPTEEYAMSGMETPAEANPNGVPAAETGEPVGVLRFQDGTAPGDQVTLNTSSIARPASGSQYEAWLIADDGEQRVSIGILQIDEEGHGSLSYVDPQGRNLIGTYHGVEITVESKPDGNPNPSDNIAYSATLPPAGFAHVRHVIYQFPGTPNQVGFIHGLMADTVLINTLAQELLAAYQANDEAKVRSLSEGMLNIIVGKQSENHKDWDNDGTVNDPGDGFGLLLNGDSEGYIQGAYSHANLAASAADATENMKVHGEHVKIAATNIGGWTTTLRDQLILILQTSFAPEMEGMIRNTVALSNQIENGFDLNGNENIEPIAGEGGAKTAYDHAYYMADMLIPGTSNQTP